MNTPVGSFLSAYRWPVDTGRLTRLFEGTESTEREEVMTRRIGITNQKGGVSKTTNAINVAGALADRGVDVLTVDMDPQGYLIRRLGFEDAYAADPPSLYDALQSQMPPRASTR